MKNKLRQAMKIALASGLIVLGLGLCKEAVAFPNPDTMVMTVTPGTPLYAVAITSPEVQGYDFSTVAIGGTTISTKPIAVQNKGNISEFFSVGVVDITTTYGWTNATSPAVKTYTMQAQFVTTGAGQPTNASFVGAALNAPAAAPLPAGGDFGEPNSQAGKTIPLNSKDLWLQLQMPTGVEETGVHTLVLTINGQST
jgi:hypothetical protein